MITALIFAAFTIILALGLLGFPTRSPRETAEHACNLLLEALQERCPHDSRCVVADVLHGALPDVAVRWCGRCGARMHVNGTVTLRATQGRWVGPRATDASVPLAGRTEVAR